ncbi:MAG: serine hydrolase [Frankia sp.]
MVRVIFFSVLVIVARVGAALEPAHAARVAPSGTPVPSATPAAVGAATPAALLRQYAGSRPGDVDVAVYDAVSGVESGYRDPVDDGFVMASSVKLSILLVRLAESGNTGYLSPDDTALARKMIGVSDNDAASDLWAEDGGAAAMDGYFHAWGMTSTVAGTGGYWGLTTTTARDQLRILRLVAYPNPTMSPGSRRTTVELLDRVDPDQRWGLTAGVPDDVDVELKDGWLPRASGWVTTSLGHVHGGGRDYVIAVLTRDGATEAANIATVSGLSTIAWKAATVRCSSCRAPALRHELVEAG